MRREKPEFVEGHPGAAKSWLIVIALYLLLLLWLEPLIDFILMQMPLSPTEEALAQLNQKKVYMSTIVFGVARSLPVMLFVWLGWQIMRAQRLPPRGLRLPLTVRLIKGRKAAMTGMGMVALGLLLLLREITLMFAVQPH